MTLKNNFLALLGLLLTVFLALIPSVWFNPPFDHKMNGLTGAISISWRFPELPIALLLSISAAKVAVTGLNWLRFTTVPRSLPALILLACGGCYTLPLLLANSSGFWTLAPYVAIAASAVAVIVAFIPSPKQA